MTKRSRPADTSVGPAMTANQVKAVGIQPHGLFHTPKEMAEVHAWIEAHPKEDRIHLYTAAYMTWNFLATQINGGQS
jgi:hypothetical protein